MKIYDCWLYWGYFFIVSGINRTIPFIQEAISPYVKHESMLNTDGFASYFAVERNLSHSIVNHSVGFRSQYRTHAYNITGGGVGAILKVQCERKIAFFRD